MVKPYNIAVYKTEDYLKSIFLHVAFKYLHMNDCLSSAVNSLFSADR